MSIRPIDFQVAVQNSTDIGRNFGNESTQTNAAQHNFVQNVQKEIKHMNEQVNNTNKSEQNKVDQNGSGGNKYQGRKRNKKNNEKSNDKNKEKKKPASTSLFDMSI